MSLKQTALLWIIFLTVYAFSCLAFPGTRMYSGQISGYFVLTSSSTYTGSLGGLAGANASCLTDLTNNNWLGKGGVLLDSSHVRSFLCDGTTCNNLNPNTTYKFAISGDTVNGGTTFTTDATGAGPNDANDWTGATYFNAAIFFWTGRLAGTATLWSMSPDTSNHCVGFTSAAGNPTKGMQGQASSTTSTRWASGGIACSSSKYLICFVNP